MNKEMFVIYNNSDVIWCYAEEAKEKLKNGWTLYNSTFNEEIADKMCKDACYLPL